MSEEGRSEELADIRETLSSIKEALTRLVLLEERQQNNKESLARVFVVLEKLEARVSVLERAAPVQQKTTDMVDRVVWLLLSGLAGAILSYTMMARPGIAAQKTLYEPAPEAKVIR